MKLTTDRNCKTCRYWRIKWAADYYERGTFGGCAKTRNARELSVVGNMGRTERMGWLETPANYGCVLWKGKKVKT